MPRLPYVDRTDLSKTDRPLIDSTSPPEAMHPDLQHLMAGRERNSYRMIAHHPAVLRHYRELVDQIKADSGLTELEQEIVVLGCAREIPSRYEWHNHARIALNFGIDPEQIRAISRKDFDAFSDAHATLLRYVIRFVHGTIDDSIHAELTAYYSADQIVAIALFAGYWLANARIVDALGVEIEEPFIGWELENS